MIGCRSRVWRLNETLQDRLRLSVDSSVRMLSISTPDVVNNARVLFPVCQD